MEKDMTKIEEPGKEPRKKSKKRAPRDPAGRRQAIIGAAADLIAREGSSKVTNRRVAEEAGVPLGSTTQYFKSIGELRREGLAEVARRIECEYDEAFRVTEQGIQNATALADFINEYLSDRQRVHADAALYAAAIEDPEVEDITRSAFESFLRRCEPFMDEQRAKILCAFMEGAIINSCFMGLPYDRETIQKAVSLILEEDDTAR